MPENPWSHLQAVVDAFRAAGNAAVAPGFRPTQGGWECEMTGPLDRDVAAACVKADPRLTYENDELSAPIAGPSSSGAMPAHATPTPTGPPAANRERLAH